MKRISAVAQARRPKRVGRSTGSVFLNNIYEEIHEITRKNTIKVGAISRLRESSGPRLRKKTR